MDASRESQLELALPSAATSYQDLLETQKNLFSSQIEQLDNLVVTQCKLTGVNPLSQEMAAGALSIKIGKRPRDLLNPKAVKYMQEVFSIKDAIGKKETREISALFGVTATQIREFFTSQRSRVRKFVRLSREKANRSCSANELRDGDLTNSDPTDPTTPVPLNSVDPVSIEEGPTISPQEEILPAVDELDKRFVDNIFNLMRKEETFSGQVKLMDWVLQVQNPSVLYWFLNKGGIMILATWLSQAAVEEQTSVLHVILKVLCHLPLQKALPVHMSAILQSVNKLRFYRASDISNRARILLAKWSKMFARSQALKKSNNRMRSTNDVQDEMLLKQSINEVMGDESWDSKLDLYEGALTPLNRSSDTRKIEPLQPLKMLTASSDDSNKKLVRGGLSSQTRERRKVLLMEQPGQKTSGRSTQVTKSTPSVRGRPLSADDIQKAKMRAQFLQSKYGKNSSSSNESPDVQPERSNKYKSSAANISLLTPKISLRPKTEEQKKPENVPSNIPNKTEVLDRRIKMDSEEPPWKKCKRVQIPWKPPPGFEINGSWKVGSGENSKEVEVQKNRNYREIEVIYRGSQEIPLNPKEPWDHEMDYDDSLTPEIPTEQLPDVDGAEADASPGEARESEVPSASTSLQNGSASALEPDLELLAVLLKNPELVFALTSGQAGNLSSEETVKLLDMIKANGLNSLGNVTGLGSQAEEKVEVSLPSPTPSNDLLSTGWKNPFSRQNPVASGGGGGRSFVQPQIPAAPVLAPQQPTVPPQLAQQLVEQLSMLQPSASVHHQQSIISSIQQINPTRTSNMHLSAPEFTMKNVSASSMGLPNLLNGAAPAGPSPPLNRGQNYRGQTSSSVMRNVMPSPGSVILDTSERSAILPYPPSMRTITPPSRPQIPLHSSYEPEPSVSHSWGKRPGSDTAAYYHGNMGRQNFTENAGGANMHAPTRPSRYWEANEAVGRPEFESWSPENSPVRSNDYFPARNYGGARMNSSHNYKPERSMHRDPGYPPQGSGYGDPTRGGDRRLRDRRR